MRRAATQNPTAGLLRSRRSVAFATIGRGGGEYEEGPSGVQHMPETCPSVDAAPFPDADRAVGVRERLTAVTLRAREFSRGEGRGERCRLERGIPGGVANQRCDESADVPPARSHCCPGFWLPPSCSRAPVRSDGPPGKFRDKPWAPPLLSSPRRVGATLRQGLCFPGQIETPL